MRRGTDPGHPSSHAFALLEPFQAVGRQAGLEVRTVGADIPFSAMTGWIFVNLEKAGVEDAATPGAAPANPMIIP